MMKISAHLVNSKDYHQTILKTNENIHSLSIPSKESGLGSKTNGGELLFLALATCYCNDIYREAAKKGITVTSVEISVEGYFDSEGAPGRDITYSARVSAKATQKEIEELMLHTDKRAEIQNTLRNSTPVTFQITETISV